MTEVVSALETIKQRISVRSYADKPVEKVILDELDHFCRTLDRGPFGAAVRLKMLDFEPLSREELRRLGTYGVIKGARLYLLGAAKEEEGFLEDLGYCMEKAVLKATALGLGTCWLGGTFRRSAFAEKMDLGPEELLPAITPLGYAREEISTADRLLRFSAGSRKRKPFHELFFAADGKTPLTEERAGSFHDALQAVRMGPSASNRQPWRIIQEVDNVYHLYLKENKLYNRMMGKIRIQSLDMGIAMCNFELVACDQNLPGHWVVDGPQRSLPGLQYVASWTG